MNCEVFYDNANTVLKSKYYSKESCLTNRICMKLTANTSLRFMYSIYCEMHFVINRRYGRCYHALRVFSKLVPRAGIAAMYKCISQLSLVPFLGMKRISIKKKINSWDKTLFSIKQPCLKMF